MKTFVDRIAYCVEKVHGQSSLARKVSKIVGREVAPQAIQYLANKKRGKPAQGSSLTAAIAAAAAVDVQWLASGIGLPEGPGMDARESLTTYQVVKRGKQSVRANDDTLRLPKFNVSGSSGAGRFPPEYEEVIDQITVAGEWIRKNLSVTRVQNLAVLTAYGDSMEGTFNGGDPLLIDRGVVDVKTDAVYVLRLGEELFVKRVQRQLDGSLRIISDNKRYDAQIVQNGDRRNVQVLGRVIYCWNGKKL